MHYEVFEIILSYNYTQNYLDFFSSEPSKNINDIFSKYNEIIKSLEYLEKFNIQLKNTYEKIVELN